MQFKWVDYCEKYEAELETWTDRDTMCYALDESIKQDHLYYLSESDYIHNETYFCKVGLEDEKIIAVLFLLSGEKYPLAINPIIVNPALRNKGYCVRVIRELIEHTERIVGHEKYVFDAGIELDNIASVRAFEKVGFSLTDKHPAGDFGYFHYQKEAPPEMEAHIKEIWAIYAQDLAKINQDLLSD